MLFSGKNIIVTGATGDLGVANVLVVAGHQSEISRLATFSGLFDTGNADIARKPNGRYMTILKLFVQRLIQHLGLCNLLLLLVPLNC